MAQKVWMITGASREFGAEMSRAVLASGDKLVATARNTRGLEHLGNTGQGTRSNLFTVALDVTDEPQVREAVQSALSHFGRIDVLVNNAGYGLMGAVEESSADEVERLYRTNVFGLLDVTRAVLPGMRKQRAGHIINFSSLGGYASAAGFGVYCSTKFAVEGITEALHGEPAPLGIHATVVEPGYFRTDFLDTSSLVETAGRIPDYEAAVGKVREFAARITTSSRATPPSSARRSCNWRMRPSRRFVCRSARTRSGESRKRTLSSRPRRKSGATWRRLRTTESTTEARSRSLQMFFWRDIPPISA
jgi:NAD(P)-dependent dehydrogenase (short-subunit alcohol dehydrogenase family)